MEELPSFGDISHVCKNIEPPGSIPEELRSYLLHIRDLNGVYELFVQYVTCHEALTYETKIRTNSFNKIYQCKS
jgi:hypothetical protein